jgi:hypothetical protein
MIDGNFYHACGVVTADGSVTCWGWNGHGQLGDGTLYDTRGPVTIAEFRTSTPTPSPQPSRGGGGSTAVISLDPHGGICLDNGSHDSIWRVTFPGFRRLPGRDQCTRTGFDFSGWASSSEPDVVLDLDLVIDRKTGSNLYLLDRRVDVVAVWTPVSGLSGPILDLTVFANFLCGPCTSAWLLFTLPTDANVYTVSVNDSPVDCTQSGTFFGLSLCELTSLTPGLVTFAVTPKNGDVNGPVTTTAVTLSS